MEINKHLGWIYPKDQDVASTQDVRDIINSQKGQNGGIATLDNNGKISSSQLPSYVDDVLEYNDKTSFPETGEESKIYVDKETNYSYRWSGSTYILIGGLQNLMDGSATGSVRGIEATPENNNYSLGRNAVALGYLSEATGDDSIALGQGKAKGVSSIALGYGSEAKETSSVALGAAVTAEGYASHAEGFSTYARGYSSHAEGYVTEAIEAGSHAEGHNTLAVGDSSHAEGSRTRAIGPRSHAEGKDTFAVGEASHAEGYNNYIQMERKTFSVAANSSNMILTNATSAFPGDSYILYIPTLNQYFFIKTKTSDNKTLTLCLLDSDSTYIFNNALTNVYCYIYYNYSIAKGQGSHAEGKSTHAMGEASHAQGTGTGAIGECSHAQGIDSQARGEGSHAEGRSGAVGEYAHSEGYFTAAEGPFSHAEGEYTSASGQYSHAEGRGTSASAGISHAEGQQTIASGGISHAEGFLSKSLGHVSHAQNIQTIAAGLGQTTLGKYNKEDETAYILTQDTVIDENKTYYIKYNNIFESTNNPNIANLSTYYEYQPENSEYAVIIGNGDNENTRSNALAVKWDGNVEIAGTPTENNHVVTKAYVDNIVSNIDAMSFKGTVGVNGTVTQLPTTNVHVGDTYRVITAGTYAGQSCSKGDLIIATSTTPTWVVAPTDSEGAIVQINGTAPVQVSTSGATTTISVDSASTSTAGLMSSADKTKLNNIETGAQANRTYTATTGKPSSNQTPGFGESVTISQISQNTTGQITATDRTIIIPSALASTSSNGLMSSEDKTKLNGITAGAQINRTYSAVTGKPTENQTPSFGDSVTISQISQNSTGQITTADKTITIPNTIATTSIAGLMSASDKTKLDGIDSGAQVNPNSLSAVSGGTTVSLVTTGEKYTWNSKVSGSGTNGYIAKFSESNSITNGPQLGSATNTYLRNDGTWAVPYSLPITKYNTLGGVKPFRNHTVAATGPTATSTSAAVAVNSISSTSGKYYAVESDSNGRLFVNVPWSSSSAFDYVTSLSSFTPENRSGGHGLCRKWNSGRVEIIWNSDPIGSIAFTTSQSSGKWYTNADWISYVIKIPGDYYSYAPFVSANVLNNGYLISQVSGVGYDSSDDTWMITIRAFSLDSRTFNIGGVQLYVSNCEY